MTTCPEKGEYSNGIRNLWCHCIAVLKGGLQWQIQTGKKKRERERQFSMLKIREDFHFLLFLKTFILENLSFKVLSPFNMYVNDAIGYGMTPEQVLYYSNNAFGTADSIIFKNELLRIHDLKTGTTNTSEHQLEIYAALFCLEYNKKPNEIDMELRIYQNDDVRIYLPDPDTIFHIMDKIIIFDKRIEKLKTEE